MGGRLVMPVNDILIPPGLAYLKKLTPAGTLSLSEGLTLAYLASKSEAAIVEIGSREGKSACFLAAGSRMGRKHKVYCIDPWERWEHYQKYHPGAHQQFKVQTEPYKDMIKPIHGFSLEIASKWTGSIGLLYVDGDHSKAYEDYQAWFGFVIEGGYVAFHDQEWDCVQAAIEKMQNIVDWHTVNRLQWGRKKTNTGGNNGTEVDNTTVS